MASTSEELAAQAEMMLQTISFFKVETTTDDHRLETVDETQGCTYKALSYHQEQANGYHQKESVKLNLEDDNGEFERYEEAA